MKIHYFSHDKKRWLCSPNVLPKIFPAYLFVIYKALSIAVIANCCPTNNRWFYFSGCLATPSNTYTYASCTTLNTCLSSFYVQGWICLYGTTTISCYICSYVCFRALPRHNLCMMLMRGWIKYMYFISFRLHFILVKVCCVKCIFAVGILSRSSL